MAAPAPRPRALLAAAALAASASAQLNPPWAPPGCMFDVSLPGAFFCMGQQLILRPCNCSVNGGAQSQHFWTGDGGGQVRHDDMVTCAFGNPIQAFYGNNEGYKPALAVTPNQCIGGPTPHPDAAWFERDRHTGDKDDVTIITNINTTGANVSALNVSEVYGCRQWAAEGDNMVDGAYLVAAPCVAGAPNRAFGFDRPPNVGCISALSNESDPNSLNGLCVALENFRAATPYVVDDSPGFAQTYDGVGITAGEGAARLLFDYPPGPRGEILDYLFKFPYALAADVLKLEIGGDGNVVQGSTPSHQHFSGEAPNVQRGTQAWLAKEARARNPYIKLYAVPWAWPGWLRGGKATNSALTDPAAAAAYVVAWLQGMSAQGTPVDIVGVESDKWDAALSPAYVQVLKAALVAAGLPVQILCDDASGGWPCADQATNSANPNYAPALLDSVDIFAGHGFPSQAVRTALAGKKPLWTTHLSDAGQSDLLGATYVSWQLSEVSLNYNVTGSIVWAAMCGAYDGMPEYNQGFVRADQPWSGHYYVTPVLWAVAHTSAFNIPGWVELLEHSGSGVLAGSGSYVTRMNATNGTFSIVISKGTNHDYSRTSNLHPEVVTFALRNSTLAAARAAGAAVGVPNGLVYVYVSNFGGSPSGNASFVQYVGNSSLYQPDPAGDWLVSVWAGLDSITTVTTSPYLWPAAGRPVTSPPAPSSFPRSFSADWTSGGTVGAPAPFLVDISGSFEFSAGPPAGLQQLAADVPLTRFQTDTAPHAILGDEEWTDVTLQARVSFPSPTDSAMIAVRASGFGDGANNHITGMDELPAVWLTFNSSGQWTLTNRLGAAAATLASGTIPLPSQQWHSAQLVARGARVVATLDNTLLASVSTIGANVPSAGFVAIGAGAFGHKPIFGGISVVAANSTCSGAPQLGHALVEEACSPGSPGQQWTFVPTQPPNLGQFKSGVDPTLCLAANRTSDAGFMGDPGARGTFVALCDPAEERQLFLVEGTIDDGFYKLGPIQGPDRFTLNVKNDDPTSNAFICAYPWQGNSNAIWTLTPSGTIWNPLYSSCITSCDPQT